MAVTPRFCPSCLSSLSRQTFSFLRPNALTSSLPKPWSASYHGTAGLQAKSDKKGSKAQDKRAKQKEKEQQAKKRRKQRSEFLQPNLKDAMQFSLVDAMRYLRAAEVGRAPTSSKYELHVRLRSPKNGPVVRNRLRLPHPVKTDIRIAVICPPDSAAARAALTNGASLVGEDSIFEAVREGKIEFDRCLCHEDSQVALQKSGVARILGPRGLMPSVKMKTVVKDAGTAVRNLAGGAEYRERVGVVRMAIGQLGFTPEEVQKNVKAFLDMVKNDIAAMSDRVTKEIHEVVLSSTNGPGMSLNGEFRSPDSPPSKDLVTW